MSRTRYYYLAAALSGLAAAYAVKVWVQRTWPNPKPPSDTDHTDTAPSKSLPPLRTDSLPPPLPNPHALLSESLVSLHTDTSVDEETSDSDSFIDLLSPTPPRAALTRHSVRAHDLFAESHISFAELGNLIAPPEEPNGTHVSTDG